MIRKICLFSLICLNFLLLTSLFAQKVDLSQHFKQLKARSIGPAGMSGRVTAIDAVHANPNIIYIGAASGGVWKTTNGGASWNPVFDDQPLLNIGAIAIQQSNPSVVWVGTGEGNPRNSVNLGEGIYKSLDGGKTWQLMGLEKTRNIHRIQIDPTNPNIVYAGAIGNPFAPHTERGVFKTIDGGQTWQRILYTNDSSGTGDMVMDPLNPNKLVVNMWQHMRTPWSFTSGGKGGGMYITWDGGKNWKKLGKAEGLPDTTGRMGFAIAKSDPNVMYAMIEATKNALYRSDDGGFKWAKVNEDPQWVSNRPFYFQDISVDPTNENRLYNIYQMIAQSDDGGKSFRIIIPYSGVHPDHHAWWIHPNNPNFIINGNDGGISISHDRGRTWQFDEKLPLGQFYHINTDNEFPYNVMGGLQDNGSWHGPAYVWSSGGIRNSYWQSVGGGDGFDVSPDPDDSKWVYSMSQGGNLGRTNRITGESWSIRPPSPAADLRLRFNWNAAFAQDPFDHNTIYYGSQFVHKSSNKGAAWQIISPDLTTNDSLKQNQNENGGITIDITNAENHCTILAIEPSTKEKGLIWVSTDDGQLQITRDGGANWINLTASIKGLPKNTWIQQIKASTYQPGEAVLVANHYRRGDFAPYIFKTTDYGKTWSRLVDEKKVKGYALCFIQDPVAPNLLFVGTEQGLWVSFDNGNAFQPFKNGYPPVSTYDLAIQQREGDLVVASFGRALYILDDIRPLRVIAANNGQLPSSKITAFPSAIAYQAEIKGPSGIEYSTYGIYAADNKTPQAAIQFYLNPAAKTDSGKNQKTDSVTIRIKDASGTIIRTLKSKADTGFNKVYWGFETKGIRMPQQPKPKPGSAEQGGGFTAGPGTYQIVINAGKVADSALLEVQYDPRITYPTEVKAAQKKLMQRWGMSITQLTEANDRLTEIEELIKRIDAFQKEQKNPATDSVRNAGKLLQDSIKAIKDFMFGKKLEKQGYGAPYQLTVMSKYNEARNLIMGKDAFPGKQEERALEIAEQLSKIALLRIDALNQKQFDAYQKLAKAMPISFTNRP